jgi:hypothetical protein
VGNFLPSKKAFTFLCPAVWGGAHAFDKSLNFNLPVAPHFLHKYTPPYITIRWLWWETWDPNDIGENRLWGSIHGPSRKCLSWGALCEMDLTHLVQTNWLSSMLTRMLCLDFKTNWSTEGNTVGCCGSFGLFVCRSNARSYGRKSFLDLLNLIWPV